VPLGKGGSHERGGERGAPPKQTFILSLFAPLVWMVADRQRHAAYRNKHWWWAF